MSHKVKLRRSKPKRKRRMLLKNGSIRLWMLSPILSSNYSLHRKKNREETSKWLRFT